MEVTKQKTSSVLFDMESRILATALAVFSLLTISAPAIESADKPSTPAPQPSSIEIKPQQISSAELSPRLERGRDLYVKNCFVCHQFNGAGIPGVFPPLAKSDVVATNLELAIKAVVEGLAGEIIVNGKKYNGAMPPVAINDEEVADVFTYILNSWGNPGGAVSSAIVADVRSRTRFKTFEKLQLASTYAPLPSPPDGFDLREVVRLPARGVRLTSDGEGKVLYMLTEDGDVFRVETDTGLTRQILWPKKYLIMRGKDVGGLTFKTVGMTMDKQKRSVPQHGCKPDYLDSLSRTTAWDPRGHRPRNLSFDKS